MNSIVLHYDMTSHFRTRLATADYNRHRPSSLQLCICRKDRQIDDFVKLAKSIVLIAHTDVENLLAIRDANKLARIDPFLYQMRLQNAYMSPYSAKKLTGLNL